MASETNLVKQKSTSDESSPEICSSRGPLSTVTYPLSSADKNDAANQAKSTQNQNDWRLKYKGNLGEIAFAEYCEQECSDVDWVWLNETAIRETYEKEFNCVDFTVGNRCIDVKTRTRTTLFDHEQLFDNVGGPGPSQTDVIVLVFLDPDERMATILGWIPHNILSNPFCFAGQSSNSTIDSDEFCDISTLGR